MRRSAICRPGPYQIYLTGKSLNPVQPHLQKYFTSRLPQISNISLTVLSHRGALRNVINAGRDAVDADGAQDEGANSRTAKSCGPDSPTLESSLAELSAG